MNLDRSWELRIRDAVWKEIRKFPSTDHIRLIKTIETLPSNPYAGDVQKMKGEENIWRRRIGAFRVFYEIIPGDKAIYVFHIERRTSKTY